jgi:hypothetical protein
MLCKKQFWKLVLPMFDFGYEDEITKICILHQHIEKYFVYGFFAVTRPVYSGMTRRTPGSQNPPLVNAEPYPDLEANGIYFGFRRLHDYLLLFQTYQSFGFHS